MISGELLLYCILFEYPFFSCITFLNFWNCIIFAITKNIFMIREFRILQKKGTPDCYPQSRIITTPWYLLGIFNSVSEWERLAKLHTGEFLFFDDLRHPVTYDEAEKIVCDFVNSKEPEYKVTNLTSVNYGHK